MNYIEKESKERHIRCYKDWKLNKKRCPICGKLITYKQRKNKFCSRSCAISYNNINRCHNVFGVNGTSILNINGNIVEKDPVTHELVKVTQRPKYAHCINCHIAFLKQKSGAFCSTECHRVYKWKIKCSKIEKAGGFPELTWKSQGHVPKKYLIYKFGHKCQICGNTEWMGKPIPLVLDHIDGKSSNWKLSNLRIVCGNCDMQLPTYKSKNKGNSTRKYRMQVDQTLPV